MERFSHANQIQVLIKHFKLIYYHLRTYHLITIQPNKENLTNSIAVREETSETTVI